MKRRALVASGLALASLSGCLNAENHSADVLEEDTENRLERCVELYAEQHGVGEGSGGVVSLEIGSVQESTDGTVLVEVESEVEVSGTRGDDRYGDVWHEPYSDHAYYHVTESESHRLNTTDESLSDGTRINC